MAVLRGTSSLKPLLFGSLILLALDSGAFASTENVSAENGSKFELIKCFFEDTALEGDNLGKPVQAATAEECQARCDRNPSCFFFTFAAASGDCRLFAAKSALRRRHLPGAVTGPRKVDCQTQPFMRCYEVGLGLTGAELLVTSEKSVQTPTQCHRLCNRVSACSLWSWDAESESCSLHTVEALPSLKKCTTNSNKVVGAKACGPWGRQFAFAASPLNPRNIREYLHQQEMYELEQLQQLQHEQPLQEQELASPPQPQASLPQGGAASAAGPVSSSQSSLQNSPCQHQDSQLSVWRSCDLKCISNGLCAYWTVDVETGECSLYSAEAASKAVHAEELLSGARFCPRVLASDGETRNPNFCSVAGRAAALGAPKAPREKSAPCDDGVQCFDSGVKLGGTDLAVVGAASAFDCFMACKHKSSCRFFTFDLENSLCHLKPVSALRSRRADAESVLFVSGSRHATPKQQTPNKTCCCGGKK